MKGRSAAGLVPCLPNCGYLDDDFGLRGGVLCQGYHPCQECSGFGLCSLGNSRDCAKSLQLPHGHGVNAEAKHPHLGALVVGGWCGIELLYGWGAKGASPAQHPWPW